MATASSRTRLPTSRSGPASASLMPAASGTLRDAARGDTDLEVRLAELCARFRVAPDLAVAGPRAASLASLADAGADAGAAETHYSAVSLTGSVPVAVEPGRAAEYAATLVELVRDLGVQARPAPASVRRLTGLLADALFSSELTTRVRSASEDGARATPGTTEPGVAVEPVRVPFFAIVDSVRREAEAREAEAREARASAEEATEALVRAQARAEAAMARVRALQQQLSSLGVNAETTAKEMEEAEERRRVEEEGSARRNLNLAREVSELRRRHALLHAEVLRLRELKGSSTLTRGRFDALEHRRRAWERDLRDRQRAQDREHRAEVLARGSVRAPRREGEHSLEDDEAEAQREADEEARTAGASWSDDVFRAASPSATGVVGVAVRLNPFEPASDVPLRLLGELYSAFNQRLDEFDNPAPEDEEVRRTSWEAARDAVLRAAAAAAQGTPSLNYFGTGRGARRDQGAGVAGSGTRSLGVGSGGVAGVGPTTASPGGSGVVVRTRGSGAGGLFERGIAQSGAAATLGAAAPALIRLGPAGERRASAFPRHPSTPLLALCLHESPLEASEDLALELREILLEARSLEAHLTARARIAAEANAAASATTAAATAALAAATAATAASATPAFFTALPSGGSQAAPSTAGVASSFAGSGAAVPTPITTATLDSGAAIDGASFLAHLPRELAQQPRLSPEPWLLPLLIQFRLPLDGPPARSMPRRQALRLVYSALLDKLHRETAEAEAASRAARWGMHGTDLDRGATAWGAGSSDGWGEAGFNSALEGDWGEGAGGGGGGDGERAGRGAGSHGSVVGLGRLLAGGDGAASTARRPVATIPAGEYFVRYLRRVFHSAEAAASVAISVANALASYARLSTHAALLQEVLAGKEEECAWRYLLRALLFLESSGLFLGEGDGDDAERQRREMREREEAQRAATRLSSDGAGAGVGAGLAGGERRGSMSGGADGGARPKKLTDPNEDPGTVPSTLYPQPNAPPLRRWVHSYVTFMRRAQTHRVASAATGKGRGRRSGSGGDGSSAGREVGDEGGPRAEEKGKEGDGEEEDEEEDVGDEVDEGEEEDEEGLLGESRESGGSRSPRGRRSPRREDKADEADEDPLLQALEKRESSRGGGRRSVEDEEHEALRRQLRREADRLGLGVGSRARGGAGGAGGAPSAADRVNAAARATGALASTEAVSDVPRITQDSLLDFLAFQLVNAGGSSEPRVGRYLRTFYSRDARGDEGFRLDTFLDVMQHSLRRPNLNKLLTALFRASAAGWSRLGGSTSAPTASSLASTPLAASASASASTATNAVTNATVSGTKSALPSSSPVASAAAPRASSPSATMQRAATGEGRPRESAEDEGEVPSLIAPPGSSHGARKEEASTATTSASVADADWGVGFDLTLLPFRRLAIIAAYIDLALAAGDQIAQ